MDNLSFFNVETAALTTALQFGDVSLASSDDSPLRVINNSDLYKAEDVIISVTGTSAIQLWLSVDGDNFASAIDVGDIPPGGTSSTFWLRRVSASTETPGAHTASLTATPTGWSLPVDTSTSSDVALPED